jgi:hypothetical protein
MALKSDRKTWSSPPNGCDPRVAEPGSMTLLLVFVFFLISALGIGVIYLSDVHLKFSRHRRDATLLSIAAENGIKRAYGALAESVALGLGPRTCSEARYNELRLDSRNGGTRALAIALEKSFPLESRGDEGSMTWAAEVAFDAGAPQPGDGYFTAECLGHVRSEGRLAGKIPAKRSSLDISAWVMAGSIPLAAFTRLVAADLSPEDMRRIAEDPDITIVPSRKAVAFPKTGFAPEAAIPKDANPFLKKAFRIKIFSPEKLTRAEIRSALGLEMVNEPVPDGVYLIENDTGLGGLFIQGDVDEMVLAVEGDAQVISLRRGEETWALRFSPARGVTSFATPSGTRVIDRTPLGMILVNGRINSLGGGVIGAGGQAELTSDETIPSVLDGVSLTIVGADEIALSSHLVLEGVDWVDGLPYLKKDSKTQLMVYANGQDFTEAADKAGKISVRSDAPANLKIQAALTAKNAFEVGGTGKTFILAGGLQTACVATHGNAIKIIPDDRRLVNGIDLSGSPVSGVPMVAVLAVRPLQWNDY